MGKVCWIVVLAVLGFAAPAAAEPSSVPEPFPVVDGSVSEIVTDGTTAWVGGNFTEIGPPSGPLVLLSAADGSVQRTFRGFAADEGVNGFFPGVQAVESDGAGGWYVGGRFERVEGRYRRGVVHLLADGSVDPAFRMDVEGSVSELALDRTTGTLWVGGSFRRVRGEQRWNLVAAEAATGALRPWLPRGAGGGVGHFELHGDRLYAAGSFSSIDGEDRSFVAAIDRDTGRVLDWDPQVRGNAVGSVEVQDGVVYLSGDIHWVVGAGEITAVIAVRESDASLVPVEYHVHGDSPSAGELLVTDDLVIAGAVTATREGARHGLAAYDRATGALLPWFEDVWGSPRTFAVSGRTVYVNGITKVGDEPRNGLAAFDLETGEFLPWAPAGPRGAVQELEVAGGQIAVGGGFRTVAGVQRRDLAAVDLRTNQVTDFDARMALWYECCGPTEAGRVDGLALAGGSLWVGGSFSRFGADQDRPYLARLNPVTGAVGPAVPAPGWKVAELYAAGGRVYLGGSFATVGGQERRRIAALDAATGALTPFANSFDCDVRAFAPLGAELLVGGCFDGGGLRSLDPVTGATGSIATPSASPEWVDALAGDSRGGAWVGGDYWSLGGAGGPEGFARVRPDGSVDESAPRVGYDDEAHALAVAGNEVYLAGWFWELGGLGRDHAAVVRADGSVGRWQPKPHGSTLALATVPDGGVLMGGSFGSMELAAASGLARFGPARQTSAPALVAPPVVTGDRHVEGGQTTDGGDYSGSPHDRDIRWLRCDAAGAGCVDTGRTGIGMLIQAEDVGHRFRVEVTASNDGGDSGPVRSEPGPLVTGEIPESHNQPEVAGDKREGATLTMTSQGSWSGGPTAFRYQWLRCSSSCRRIPGATGTSYTLTAADVNTSLALEVRGSNAAGEGGGRSRDYGPILPAAGARRPQNLVVPVVRGVIRNPTTLFADRGEWSNYPDYVHHTWERCTADGGSCESTGYNSETYRVTAEDAGYRLRVAARGENELGYSDTVYSEPSPVIPAPDADPPAEDPPGEDPPGEDPPAQDPPVEEPPGEEPPVEDPPAEPASAPALTSGSAFAPLAAAEVRVLSARAATGRRVVVRLSSTGAVRTRIVLRRRGRAIAAAVADLRAGTNAVRVRLPRSAWRALRGGTLRIVVAADGAPARAFRLRR